MWRGHFSLKLKYFLDLQEIISNCFRFVACHGACGKKGLREGDKKVKPPDRMFLS